MAAAAGGGGASTEEFPLHWAWDRDYGFGSCINLVSGKVASALSPFKALAEPAAATTASFSSSMTVVKNASSYADATSASFEVHGEYGWSAVSKVTASASGSITNRMAHTENAMHGVVNAAVVCDDSMLSAQELASLELSDDAVALLQDSPERFVAEYGHGVIIGVQKAAKVTGIVTATFHDESSKRSAEASIEATLETSAFSGGAKASASHEAEASASGSCLSVTVECEGIDRKDLRAVSSLSELHEWLHGMSWSGSGTPVQAKVCPWHRLGAVFRKAGLGEQHAQLPSGRPHGTATLLREAARVALEANWLKLNTDSDNPIHKEAVSIFAAAKDALRGEASLRSAIETGRVPALHEQVRALRTTFEQAPGVPVFSGSFSLWNVASKYFLLTISKRWKGEQPGFTGANPAVAESPKGLLPHAMFEPYTITWQAEAGCHSIWAQHRGCFLGVNAANQVIATRKGSPAQFETSWEDEKWHIRVIEESGPDDCPVVAFRHLRTGRWLLLQPQAPGKAMPAAEMSAPREEPPSTDTARFALGKLAPPMHFKGTYSVWNPATKYFLLTTGRQFGGEEAGFVGANPAVNESPTGLVPHALFERFTFAWHHEHGCHSIWARSLGRFVGVNKDHPDRLQAVHGGNFDDAPAYDGWYVRILQPSAVEGCPLVALQNMKSRGWLRLDGPRTGKSLHTASMSERALHPPEGDEYRFMLSVVPADPVPRR